MNIKEITERLLNWLFKCRSLPYVALVTVTAIVGIATDNGAEIRIGNTYYKSGDKENCIEPEAVSEPEKVIKPSAPE